MDVTITEKRLTEVLHKYLNTTIKGFDKCGYDWAEFGCGMGVCCDPYAIVFHYPIRIMMTIYLSWLMVSFTMIVVITLKNLVVTYLRFVRIHLIFSMVSLTL